MMMDQRECGIVLQFSPEWWSLISSTRIFVASFCGTPSFGVDSAADVAMVVHELLENAVKYSTDKVNPVSCRLILEESGVAVEVANACAPAGYDFLRDEVDRVMDGDPLDRYLDKMRQTLEGSYSRLGLARIRYEAGADLSVTFQEPQVVVRAAIPYRNRVAVG
jgi:hypothetical protein